MAWARFDDGLATHPKFLECSELSKLTFMLSVIYCSREMTDGRLTAGAIRVLFAQAGPETSARAREITAELLECGLWERRGGDIWVHDYLEYNPSRTQIVGERESARLRMQNRRSSEVQTNNGRCSPEHQANYVRNSPAPVPVPLPLPESPTPAAAAARPPAPAREEPAAEPQPTPTAAAAAEDFVSVLAGKGYTELEIRTAYNEVISRPRRRAITDWARYLEPRLNENREMQQAAALLGVARPAAGPSAATPPVESPAARAMREAREKRREAKR